MNPLISIITPTYNHEDYIKQCIDSVLSQTYPYWEMIIIDDGSTDNTANLISEYDDKRIIYLKQENQGIYNLKKTYNHALKISKGEYIAVLEGDDYWPEYKLERQINTLKDHDLILCCGNAEMVDEAGRTERIIHKELDDPEILKTEEIMSRLLLGNFITSCTVICKKEALIEIGGFKQPPDIPYVDYPTWLALSRGGSFYLDNTILGYWRHHKGQISTKNAFEMLDLQWNYSIHFYHNLSREEKKGLKIQPDDIIRSRNRDQNYLNFLMGRRSMHNKEWAKSRGYFRESLKGSPSIKFYSTMAIIASFLNLDLERYISRLKRTHIDDLME